MRWRHIDLVTGLYVDRVIYSLYLSHLIKESDYEFKFECTVCCAHVVCEILFENVTQYFLMCVLLIYMLSPVSNARCIGVDYKFV